MAGSSSDGDVDYWPGYVDALTSMVKVLTFVMMLLALTVFVISQQVSRNIVEKVAEAAKVKVAKDAKTEVIVEQIIKQLAETQKAQEKSAPMTRSAEAAAASVAAPTPKIESPGATIDAKPEEKTDKPAEIATALGGDQDDLTITFKGYSVKLDDAAAQALRTFVTLKRTKGSTAFIVSAKSTLQTGSISERRRAAYYRMMVIRQSLVEAGIATEAIALKMPEDLLTGDVDIVRISAR